MATKSTIHKAEINIANMDSHYYAEHHFTIAKHPSETDLRMMVRLTAFILNAEDDLAFTKGISQDDEPDLWKKSLGGDIELWIDLGQPDEKRIKKACGRSRKVIIYTYQEGMAVNWWKSLESSLARFTNLKVVFLQTEGDLEVLSKRAMHLQANIIDGELTLMEEDTSVLIRENIWMS